MSKHPVETSTIAAVAEALAFAASNIIALSGASLSAESALDFAARAAVDNATNARTRSGQWARESTTEQIEEALFFGSVAKDVLDGDTTRPSTGNVRQYALKSMP